MEIDHIQKLIDYVPPKITLPKKNKPISLSPFAPLEKPEPLDEEIMKVFGLDKKESNGFGSGFNFLFPCTGTCLAVSKETLQEINTNQDILNEEKKHLRDENRKNEYKNHWKYFKKRTIKK